MLIEDYKEKIMDEVTTEAPVVVQPGQEATETPKTEVQPDGQADVEGNIPAAT